mmetsp:Transcript_12931/g.45251  ORF Transcript_12931/g.45251 Transcript_12931/m.45251 type:complete len:442 (-) Transcript_12931:296-1621(-)
MRDQLDGLLRRDAAEHGRHVVRLRAAVARDLSGVVGAHGNVEASHRRRCRSLLSGNILRQSSSVGLDLLVRRAGHAAGAAREAVRGAQRDVPAERLLRRHLRPLLVVLHSPPQLLQLLADGLGVERRGRRLVGQRARAQQPHEVGVRARARDPLPRDVVLGEADAREQGGDARAHVGAVGGGLFLVEPLQRHVHVGSGRHVRQAAGHGQLARGLRKVGDGAHDEPERPRLGGQRRRSRVGKQRLRPLARFVVAVRQRRAERLVALARARLHEVELGAVLAAVGLDARPELLLLREIAGRGAAVRVAPLCQRLNDNDSPRHVAVLVRVHGGQVDGHGEVAQLGPRVRDAQVVVLRVRLRLEDAVLADDGAHDAQQPERPHEDEGNAGVPAGSRDGRRRLVRQVRRLRQDHEREPREEARVARQRRVRALLHGLAADVLVHLE